MSDSDKSIALLSILLAAAVIFYFGMRMASIAQNSIQKTQCQCNHLPFINKVRELQRNISDAIQTNYFLEAQKKKCFQDIKKRPQQCPQKTSKNCSIEMMECIKQRDQCKKQLKSIQQVMFST